MKKHIFYALCLLVVVGSFSACKKVAQESVDNRKTTVYEDGTTVTKIYRVVPGEAPQKEAEVKEESPKMFLACQAKRILRKQLEKENQRVHTASIRVGYYECNDYEERLNLYKLAANKLITLQCDEIVTEYGPTYWVTVDLTWRGWWLKENPDKKLFPEDRIDQEEAKAFLTPALDQDPWGIPSTDTVVSPIIVDAMKVFYGSLQAGHSYDQSLMDAKMVCAMSLLDSLSKYGVDKLGFNPFTRDAQLTKEAVHNLSVLRMPRMENAYLVTVGENSFVYVIEQSGDDDVAIVDLAYLAPADIKSLNQTVCSLAGKLTKEEILAAREAKRLRDEYEARMRVATATARLREEQAKPEDDFEMCATSGSLKMVQHDDPTLYELAKEAEHFEEVVLRAGVTRVTRIDDLKVTGNKKEAFASAKATFKLCRVNAVGRIYLDLTDGDKATLPVNFKYTRQDGWELDD